MFHSYLNKDGIDALLGQLAAGYPGEYRTWEVPTAGSPGVYVGRWFDRPGPDGQRRRFADPPPPARYVRALEDRRPLSDLQKLKLALDNAGERGLTRTDIRGKVFHSMRTKDEIDALLGQLAAGYPGEYRTWEVPTVGSPGVYVGPWFDRPGPDGQRRRFPDPPGARYVQPLGDPVPATRREADLRRLKLAIGEKKELGISRGFISGEVFRKRA